MESSNNSKIIASRLNKDLEIPLIKSGGAYHIIAKICNLDHLGNGIFINKDSNIKYILTKYGFRHNTDYNYQVRYAETIRELRQLRSDYGAIESNCDRKIKGITNDLKNQIDLKNKKIKNQAEAVNSHREKIDRQAEQIKNQRDKIKELYMLLNENKDETLE